MRCFLFAVVAMVAFVFNVVHGQGSNPLVSRPAHKSLRLPLEIPPEGYGLVDAFPGLKFDRPVAMVSPPGETNRLFIVERPGRIQVITNLAAPTASVFLDLQAQTYSEHTESGLLGLAFHPGYATNGYFYIFRSLVRSTERNKSTLHQQVSRFQVSGTDANAAQPDSELVLIAQADSSTEHNAGDLKFGPDGFLYISFGDTGPPAAERSTQLQAIDAGFFGVIARIDVDHRADSLMLNSSPATTQNYRIPADNPFIGVTTHNGLPVDPAKIRTEIYAFGLRNPWRISFDPRTGELWCGDVGGGVWEEINRIEKGGNYGWPYLEGLDGPIPPEISTIPPVLTIPHGYNSDQGLAVIGGVVYDHDAIPELKGAYVFGDFGSGSIWAMRRDEEGRFSRQFLTAARGISAFGTDPASGDVLVANHSTGIIHRLKYTPPGNTPSLPQTLADTGVFHDLVSLQPAPGVIPYSLNVPFWSDNAIKTRWFSLPDAFSGIEFNALGNWKFPNGMIWIKQFDLLLTNGVPESKQRVETRLLVKNSEGVYGLSYRWDENGANAALVPEEGANQTFLITEGGTVRTQLWQFPSRMQCGFCHTPEAGYALGFNTAQLNRPHEAPESTNQIQAFEALGYFSTPVSTPPDRLPALAPPDSSAHPLGFRARSYLSANCSSCHQPGASAGNTWDARAETPLAQARIIDHPANYSLDETPARENWIVAPGNVARSMITQWMGRREVFQMPPVATTLVDSNGLELLQRWINSIPAAPWSETALGDTPLEHYSSLENGRMDLSVSSSAQETTNAFHFVHLPLRNNGHLIARLENFTATGPQSRAGMMLRAGAEPDALLLAILHAPDGFTYIHRRTARGEVEIRQLAPAASARWLRIARQESNVVAYYSANRERWNVAGTVFSPSDANLSVGLAVAPGNLAGFSTAEFSELQSLSIAWQSPGPDETLEAPGPIRLSANISTLVGNGPARVEFLAGNQSIGEASAPPYEVFWTNPSAGKHSIRARATDAGGVSVVSETIELNIGLGNSIAQFDLEDPFTLGNWRGIYGLEGFSIPGGPQHFDPGIVIELEPASARVWDRDTADESALQLPDSAGRVASAWTNSGPLSLTLRLNDARLHQVALYFMDWDSNNLRSQSVRVFNGGNSIAVGTNFLSHFSAGKFLTWAVRGEVKFEIQSENELPAVLNGIFINPLSNLPPSVALTGFPAEKVTLPAEFALQATASDTDGFIQRVEFWDGGNLIGTVSAEPFALVWTNALAGKRQISAKAYDNLGDRTDSASIGIEIERAPALAEFVGMDFTTAGNWRQFYPNFVIPLVATNLPPGTSLNVLEGDPWHWPDGTNDTRVVQMPEGDSRIAIAWTGENLVFHLSFDDGAVHPVALYFLDWAEADRSQTITITEEGTSRLLSTQAVSQFESGVYLVWNIRGSVQIEISALTANAVLQGMFLNPISPGPAVEPLRLSWRPGSESGKAQLLVQGPRGRTVKISASTSLGTWETWATVEVPESGFVELAHPFPAEGAALFYKAELAPPTRPEP